jgi:hypothetical protein
MVNEGPASENLHNCGLMRRTKKHFLDDLPPLIKQASVGVATTREDRRPPRSDPAVQPGDGAGNTVNLPNLDAFTVHCRN